MEKKRGFDTYSSVGKSTSRVVQFEYTDVIPADFDAIRQDAVEHVTGRRLSPRELEELHVAQSSAEGAVEFNKRHKDLPVKAANVYQNGVIEDFGGLPATTRRSHVVFDRIRDGETGKARLTTYTPAER